MLVVFPPSIRHDDGITPSYYEDHLLERVSLLELRLAQLTEQLAMAYEFIGREAKSFQKDHALLQSFFETLEKINPELSNEISKATLENLNEKKRQLAVADKQEQVFNDIFSNHNSKQTELFSHLVKLGIDLLEKNEEKQAFSMLERAVSLSPENVPLLVFIAEHFYRADKFEEAKQNLEKAFEIAPQNKNALLLLGAIYADQVELEASRRLLSILINQPEKHACINYIWAFLAAFEENWTESLTAFKICLKETELPEFYYLTGCVYFQLSQYENALQHLRKALSLDIKFADAWFMQSVIYEILNNEESAKNALIAAAESKEAGAQCSKYLSGKKKPNMTVALPFSHFKKTKKQLLTGGSLRLKKISRELIFDSIG